MNCYEYLPLLSGHIDQMNTVQEEQVLQEHLASCPLCRKLLAQMDKNDRLLRQFTVLPPANLTARIMKEVRKNPKKSRVNKPAVISAIVSGLTVAAVMSLIFFGKSMLQATLPTRVELSVHDGILPAASEPQEAYTEADIEENNSLYTALEEPPTERDADTTAAATDPSDAVSEPTTSSQETGTQYVLPEVIPEVPADSLTETSDSPVKRTPTVTDHFSLQSPVLVIWNADSESISALSEYEPDTSIFELFADVSPESPVTLISRLSSALPLSDSDPSAEAANWEVSAYRVPYDLILSLFHDCIGSCEVNAYYPPEIQNSDDCIVFVVRQADDAPSQEES